MKPSDLRNLGARTDEMLAAVDIDSAEELGRIGSVQAYRLVRDARMHPSLNLLWSLEGALLDLDWRELTPEMKQDLLDRLGA